MRTGEIDVGAGRGLDWVRLRVWPNAVAGATRIAASETTTMRLNMVLLFGFPGTCDCTKDRAGCYNRSTRIRQKRARAVAWLKPGSMVNERKLLVQRLGRVDYQSGLTLQKEIEQSVKLGAQPDTLLLLEHPHTLTIGRRGDNSAVLLDAEGLKAKNVTLFETNRGGKVTYHGLGQLVGYPIVKLSPDREDVHRYMRDLEEVLLRTMADFGIEAFRIDGLTGVYTARGKIAAIGVHIARWVTTHGFALNVNTDLSYFDFIIACEGEPVTSMEQLLGSETQLNEVEDRIVAHFQEVFAMRVEMDSCLQLT